MGTTDQLVKSITFLSLFLKITEATINVARGEDVSINDDDWRVVGGHIQNVVDDRIDICVEFGSKKHDPEKLVIFVDLQNFTRVVRIDVYANVNNNYGYVLNETQESSAVMPCQVYEECDVVGKRVAFLSDKGMTRVMICEIQIFGCPVGFYGEDCSEVCRCIGDCDPDDGHCSGQCFDGWIGSSCDKPCQTGFYGPNCSHECLGNCFDGITCNPMTGHCQSGCIEGWTGPKCDIMIEAPAVAELVTPTSIGLAAGALIIMMLLVIAIICILRKKSKSDSDESGNQRSGRRRFLPKFLQSPNNKKDSRNEKEEKETCSERIEAEYIDLNEEENRNTRLNSLSKAKSLLMPANKRVNPELDYQSLLKNEERVDVHFYEKKETTSGNKQTTSPHPVPVKPHPTKKPLIMKPKPKTGPNGDIAQTMATRNNKADGVRNQIQSVSTKSEQDDGSIYLEPFDTNERQIDSHFKKLTSRQHTNETIATHIPDSSDGHIGNKLSNMASKPETEVRKNSGKKINSILQQLQSGSKSENISSVFKTGPIKTSKKSISNAEALYDQPEEFPSSSKNRLNGVVKRINSAQTPPKPVVGRLQNTTRSMAAEPVYDLPEHHHYDYIDEQPTKFTKSIYPQIVKNGIKLPKLK